MYANVRHLSCIRREQKRAKEPNLAEKTLISYMMGGELKMVIKNNEYHLVGTT